MQQRGVDRTAKIPGLLAHPGIHVQHLERRVQRWSVFVGEYVIDVPDDVGELVQSSVQLVLALRGPEGSNGGAGAGAQPQEWGGVVRVQDDEVVVVNGGVHFGRAERRSGRWRAEWNEGGLLYRWGSLTPGWTEQGTEQGTACG